MRSFIFLALAYVLASPNPTLIQVAGRMRPMNINRTAKYSRYATAAYCKGPLLENFECKSCKGIKARFMASFGSSRLDTSGYIAVDDRDKRIVMAFRGTGGLRNQLSDIAAMLVPFLESPVEGSLVHGGFKYAMDSMATKFLPILADLFAQREYSNYTLALTGHSLGGSIASLAAVRVHTSLELPWTRMELYTYGQPRTSNVIFSKWLSQQPIGSARVVQDNDIVPHLMPVALSYYAHHHNEVWIDSNGTVLPCKRDVLEDRNCSYSVPVRKLALVSHNLYFQNIMGIKSC
ncbi:hypothetical protein DSO57_1012935 [Entomophthora muscae]|uniref:Uncharacterized protein n=2 Tax=Entomophthora muscae TaxID=34485 RepID=A0ACC2T446_9FUNG|nr:hypothetical protein DSO57_1019876 [Entomophthora muscae]KAJ9081608.1 hypothetical protein DSO57_1012935 [Entomophthora muscae]